MNSLTGSPIQTKPSFNVMIGTLTLDILPSKGLLLTSFRPQVPLVLFSSTSELASLPA